jgi:hypothetical protein
MNSHAAPSEFFAYPAFLRPDPVSSARHGKVAQPRTDWMELLAAWAERQYPHHRCGSWERLG